MVCLDDDNDNFYEVKIPEFVKVPWMRNDVQCGKVYAIAADWWVAGGVGSK